MTGLGRHALVPRTFRGRVYESALTVTCHAPLLPMCGLVAPGRGLLTAAVANGYTHTLGATAHGHDDCAHDRLAVARP